MMTTTESATPKVTAGLLAGDVPVPLEGISVEASVNAASARVTIVQRYRNHEARPIEAVYVFPLDEGAAVCGFEAVSGGVHYVAEVKPRDEAFTRYDDALQAGHRAYLLDEERPDVFTASVGNLPPGAEVLLKLTYVVELALDGPAVRFTLPTTVSPRYAPAEDRVGVGRSEEETLNPPVAWRVPYGLDLSVDVRMPEAITRVASPSHPLSIAVDGARATVTLAQADTALDRDVVVLIEARGLETPHAIVECDAGGRHAAAIVFQPAFELEQAPSEIIFLVDRSGSMQGTSIAEVRNALQLCLRSLTAGSRFDIVGFGSTFQSLFGESRPYEEDTLAAATEHVSRMKADMAGTEVLPALTAVLGRSRQADLPRQIVIFTDGQVTNTDAVIALVRQHAATTRVFTFGIGRGSSAHLVRGLARAGNGAAEFIYPGERVEAKVLRQFARVLAPALTDVRVDWGGLEVRPAPTVAPAVFAGGRVVVYGWIANVKPAVVTLSARGPQGPVSFAVPLDPAGATAGTTLTTLAARTLIRELEESPDVLTARGSKQGRRPAASRATDEIVRLATMYGLASRETSFVAVERREVPVEGDMALRRIPVALTSGWGGMEDAITLGVSAFDPGRVSAASPGIGTARSWGAFQLGVDPEAEAAPRLLGSLRAMYSRPLQSGSDRPLDRLVALQRADGSWELSKTLTRALGLSVAKVSAGRSEVAGAADPDRAWATAVALAWLERHASDTRDEWTLLARKAEAWLRAAAGDADTLQRWQRAAEAMVG
jgi:Ca-activated chloride channel family protein